MVSRKKILLMSASALVCVGAIELRPLGKAVAQLAQACDTPTTPFCSAGIAPPPGWTGPVFHLAQNYPASIPQDVKPWLAFDPKTQPQQYINAILAYFYEGNIQATVEASFDPTLNTKRGWFNAPWQDVGLNGREPLHGLTRERTSRPGELGTQQIHAWNNYAVGFYNAPGGFTIGRMWANHGAPNPAAAASLPDGTVAAKLLFTTASVSEVPYLQGSPEWSAYIFADPTNPAPTPTSPKAVLKVRLLQIDIAVKDSRLASTTGWAFGTYVYGGGPGGKPGAGWTNVAPVGLMWGNDPGYSGTGPLRETFINPAVTMPHLGYQGRLNGPVDNKVSSCLSCHSTAETPAGAMISTGNPAPWFRNIPSGQSFDPGRQALDYSLQLSVGLSNFAARIAVLNEPNPSKRMMLIKRLQARDNTPPRDGGPVH